MILFPLFFRLGLCYNEIMEKDYRFFMAEAIKEAQYSEARGDVPVGAVAVYNGEIIAKGRNRKEADQNPTAHAEIEAIQKAAKKLGSWRLKDVTLYVTMEPCPMCAGAILQARIGTVVFGAWDVNWGALGSKTDLLKEGIFNHTPEIIGGICEKECAALTENFFRRKRKETL